MHDLSFALLVFSCFPFLSAHLDDSDSLNFFRMPVCGELLFYVNVRSDLCPFPSVLLCSPSARHCLLSAQCVFAFCVSVAGFFCLCSVHQSHVFSFRLSLLQSYAPIVCSLPGGCVSCVQTHLRRRSVDGIRKQSINKELRCGAGSTTGASSANSTSQCQLKRFCSTAIATLHVHSSFSCSALMTNLKNAKFSYDIMKEKHYLRPDLSKPPFSFCPFLLLFSSQVVRILICCAVVTVIACPQCAVHRPVRCPSCRIPLVDFWSRSGLTFCAENARAAFYRTQMALRDVRRCH